jgi:purine-binding chemotaxis protein CheW
MLPSPRTMADHVGVVEFRLGGDRYCLGIDAVTEIVDAEVTPLPNTPARVAGVTDLRGQTARVLDPRAVFDVGDPGPDSGERVVMLDTIDDPRGWLVDDVRDVHRVDLADVDESFEGEGEGIRGLVRIAENDFMIWVDADAV